MKKLVFALVISAVLWFSAEAPVFAQTSGDKDSEYYYVKVPVEKIYQYHAGYVVTYRKGVFSHAQRTVYLPLEWFKETHPAAKGEIVPLDKGQSWPNLTVYYKDGQFSHVRLYVHKNRAHETWGNVPMGTNLDERFQNVEEIKLEFE